jgi:hypothetical protein
MLDISTTVSGLMATLRLHQEQEIAEHEEKYEKQRRSFDLVLHPQWSIGQMENVRKNSMHTFKIYCVFRDGKSLRCGFHKQPASLDAAWQEVQQDYDLIARMANHERMHQGGGYAPLWRIGAEELNEKGKRVDWRLIDVSKLEADDEAEPEPTEFSKEPTANWKVTTAEGVELRIELIEHQNDINVYLGQIFQRSALRELKKQLKHVKEVAFIHTAVLKAELPIVKVMLFHLCYEGGSSLLIFRVHKDHVKIAEREAEDFKKIIKEKFGWDASQSGSHALPDDHYKLPTIPIDEV